MEIVISHLSAFRFWRRFAGDISQLHRVSRPKGTSRGASISSEVRAELISCGWSSQELNHLDLLYENKTQRSRAMNIHAHSFSEPLPANSIIRIAQHVGIVSPEICLIQLSHILPEPSFLMTVYEFCGTFTTGCEREQLHQRRALTSVEGIRAVLDQRPPHFTGKTRRFLPFMLNGAASPMEAKLALVLTLPPRKGGFGLPAPILNAPITLGSRARKLYQHRTCRADLFWPNVKLDLEYDSESFHTGAQHTEDIARRNALELEGIEVISVCQAQLIDTAAIEMIARRIAKRLGYRIQPRCNNFALKQMELQHSLRTESNTLSVA